MRGMIPWTRPPRRPHAGLLRCLRRRSDGRMLGGVATGIAARFGFDVTLVRLGFVLATVLSGFGAAVYVVAWLVLPCDDDTDWADTIVARSLTDGRGMGIVVALIPVAVLLLVGIAQLQQHWVSSIGTPVCISALGLVFVWRNGSDEERAALRRAVAPIAHLGSSSKPTWRRLAARLTVGAGLAGLAAADFKFGNGGSWLWPLSGVGLALAAVVVMFGPWWLTLAKDLVVERQARLRAEERAEMAARVHDSVLQTLALIQRNADEPQRVAQLARAQERELRAWLFAGDVPGSFAHSDKKEAATVAGAVSCIQEEVEAAHRVRVEAVVVGDCPLTPKLDALLAAGREATVNAAKWSGAGTVSLFVEVEADQVSLFVRDRGKGFDPATVAPDRRGLAQSVRGRIARHGGSAVLRTAIGEGTEWELTMPRAAGNAA